MTKQEFLQGLRAALEGEVPPAAIQENLRYYEGYFSTESQKGRAETDVAAELGDPRWIAKTIIETTPVPGEGRYEQPRQSGADYSGASPQDSFSGQRKGNVHYYNLNKWYVKLAVILAVVLLFSILLAIIGGMLSLLMPLFPVIAMVALVMWIIRGSRN